MMPPMQPIRATLYARYSTDKQRETSIDDQLRAARERVAREAWTIVAQHADEGVSGSVPVALRAGGKALLADALAGRFDVLVMEGLDRLSRELGEAEQLVKRLEHRGIRIIGTADGYDTAAKGRKVMRIARGLVNELYLDDLREKTHRGLAGQFDRGYHVGGVQYGYRTEPSADGRGRVLVVDEVQSAVVVSIYERFADGHSVRAIAHQLNAAQTPAPRGGTWAVSCLQGSAARGLGLLHAEIYRGRVTWNKRQWLKDPDTGKRRYVERPRAEWQQREQPELRIVDEALWQRTRDRMLRPGAGTRNGRGGIARSLFGGSGVLRCPACAGPMVAVDGRRYGCSRHLDRGATVCANRAAFPRQATDDALLGVVRAELLAPEALAELHGAVRRALASQARDAGTAHDEKARRTRQAALRQEIDRLADAVAQLGLSAALRARLQAAEAELATLDQANLRKSESSKVPSADAIVAAWRRQMLQLRQALEDTGPHSRDQVRTLLADVIGPVTLVRDAGGAWAEMQEPAERLLVAGSAPTGVVAGVCNLTRRRVRIA
jgi:site-specific DNA recombinase